MGDGKTYYLDLDYGKTDNGTNIGIYSNTHSDAQLFKFLDNGDGTYTIATKPTKDQSCIGIAAGSKEEGANVVQWARDGSDNQKWMLEQRIEPLEGTLIRSLLVQDRENDADWSIVQSIQNGDPVFGDRDAVYTALPAQLAGAEYIRTACDSKNSSSDLAVFTAGAHITVYTALDSRVTALPAWLKETGQPPGCLRKLTRVYSLYCTVVRRQRGSRSPWAAMVSHLAVWDMRCLPSVPAGWREM